MQCLGCWGRAELKMWLAYCGSRAQPALKSLDDLTG